MESTLTKYFNVDDPLFGYKKIGRDEVASIPVGAMLKWKDGDGKIRRGGRVIEVLYPRAVVNTIIRLQTHRPWNLRFLSASEIYIKVNNDKREAIKEAIGKDVMEQAYERVRLKILARKNNDNQNQ